jgi:hypothetical protein
MTSQRCHVLVLIVRALAPPHTVLARLRRVDSQLISLGVSQGRGRSSWCADRLLQPNTSDRHRLFDTQPL